MKIPPEELQRRKHALEAVIAQRTALDTNILAKRAASKEALIKKRKTANQPFEDIEQTGGEGTRITTPTTINFTDAEGYTLLDYALLLNDTANIQSLKAQGALPARSDFTLEQEPTEVPENNDPRPCIDQTTLYKKLHYYFRLTHQYPYTLDAWGQCAGWGYLYLYYSDRGKQADFFKILESLANWDETYESLNENRTELPGDCKTLHELFFETAQAVILLQATTTHGQLPHTFEENYKLLQKNDDKSIIARIPKIGTRLFPYSAVGEKSAEQLTEYLDILSNFPGEKIEITLKPESESPHFVGLYIQDHKTFYVYDPNEKNIIPAFNTIPDVVSYLQNTAFKRIDPKNHTTGTYELNSYTSNAASELYFTDETLPKNAGDVQKFIEKSPNQLTPLHVAILSKNIAHIRAILTAAPEAINYTNQEKQSPLDFAFMTKQDVVILELLSHPNLILPNEYLQTAYAYKNDVIFEKVLDVLKIKIPNYNATILYDMVDKNDITSIKKFLDMGGTPNPPEIDSDGMPIILLELAFKKNQYETAALLMQKGACPTKEYLNRGRFTFIQNMEKALTKLEQTTSALPQLEFLQQCKLLTEKLEPNPGYVTNLIKDRISNKVQKLLEKIPPTMQEHNTVVSFSNIAKAKITDSVPSTQQTNTPNTRNKTCD